MQPVKKCNDSKTRKDVNEAKKEEKLKRGLYTNSTTRDFIQKSSTISDIYAQKKKPNVNAPKKILGSTNLTSSSPMKGLLKSSASSVSQKSTKKVEPKSSVKNEKKAPLTNVTVNSPIVKRKLDLTSGDTSRRNENKPKKETSKETKEVGKERQRTKTRTLDDDEVKVLNSVDNNAEMLNLSQKLVAKPKSFYVALDEDKPKPKEKSSDEEVSYEDDFESYESDFESYHSDRSDEKSKASTASDKSEESDNNASEKNEQNKVAEDSFKEGHEENMLDSGNFDLRSAKTKPPMEFITELEERKAASLTDEGFQDMSTASAASSIRIDDRPMFLDFTKAKQNKLKRQLHERLKQRANDLLSMITLHEMSYHLFEMKPISYDLYMATFGRSNYTQSGVQTYDDGITEEVQTEEATVSQKWTQYPVEFSNKEVHLTKDVATRKFSKHTEDYLTKFTFLMKQNDDENKNDKIDESYVNNPLRIYLEQKDGVGGDEMLPYETYKTKLKSNSYDSNRLGKFLKKYESDVSQILSKNSGNKVGKSLNKNTKIPFSKGFISLSKMITEELSKLKYSKITRIIFSQTKLNLMLTVHKKAESDVKKSLICLWDLSVASDDPIKVLTVIDDVTIGKFRGSTDGVFVAALADGSIHLWDLSEEPTWRADVASAQNPKEFVEIDAEKLTEFEKDREWNLRNRHVGLEQDQPSMALHSCAYTNSACNMTDKSRLDAIVGLEINSDVNLEERGRVIGQIISLQKIGILTIWSIVQERYKTSQDIGKAFTSKMRLEKCQTIQISDHIDTKGSNENISFNLNSAKRRIMLRKQEKNIIKKKQSRPASAASSKFEFDIDRPASAASLRKRVLPVEINVPKNWETGIVCGDLKIMRIDYIDHYLVAKNCGEVLICKRCLGTVKIEKFVITNDTASVTSIEVSTSGLPYFLAATDTGTVNLCSILDRRVLLTLDCRNIPQEVQEKCQSDHKGRYISSASWRPINIDKPLLRFDVKSVHWSSVNPCRIYVILENESLLLFELTHSDINAKYLCENAARQCAANDVNMAILTADGEVQVHRLKNELESKENLNIFEKYVALL